MRRRFLAGTLLAAAAAGVGGFLLLGGEAIEPTPPRRTTIEQALASFVRNRFGVRYIGRCPQELPPEGEIPRGICSERFSGSGRRAVYGLGPPFSEWDGEAVLLRAPSGSWRVEGFQEYPPLGSSLSPGAATPSPPTAPSWDGPGAPDASGAISVTEFNSYLDQAAPAWADAPARIALEFLDLGDPGGEGAFTTTLRQEANPEAGDRATVTVTLEGLLDDSVEAIRYTLRFRRGAGGDWDLLSATWAQRCASGRGHQGFGTDPCV